MKNLFNQRLVKILLIVLFYCTVAFTQVSYIKYNGNLYEVKTNTISFVVKKDYYNDELLEKLNHFPYSLVLTLAPYRSVFLDISGDVRDMNILDYYLEFEKEEFVEKVVPYEFGKEPITITIPQYYLKGQVMQDGKPLSNSIVNLGDDYNSITDEDGNYIFPNMEKGSYILSFKIGNIRYDTTLILDDDKVINFNSEMIMGGIGKDIPTAYSLSQNYPNPFNPTTNIQFTIPKDEYVKLVVYDITGKIVKELVNGHKSAGTYNIEFNASGYASGTYYYKLEAGDYNSIQKMMLVK
jgi:hypothetical protein